MANMQKSGKFSYNENKLSKCIDRIFFSKSPIITQEKFFENNDSSSNSPIMGSFSEPAYININDTISDNPIPTENSNKKENNKINKNKNNQSMESDLDYLVTNANTNQLKTTTELIEDFAPTRFRVFTRPSIHTQNKQLEKLIKKYSHRNGKIKKLSNKAERKLKSDLMRKKMKAHFHKILRKNINQKLKNAGSRKYIQGFNQNFITNVSKKVNKRALNLTLEYLLQNDIVNDNTNKVDKKYEINKKTLKYLDSKVSINVKSKFKIIRKMKYKELLSEYLDSQEYRDFLLQVEKKNKENYFLRFLEVSVKFINFYSK